MKRLLEYINVKNLSQFISESSWIGCKWTADSVISLTGNDYQPFDISKVKEYMDSFTEQHKWHNKLNKFIKTYGKLENEEDIENFITSHFKSSGTYKNCQYKDYTKYVKSVYDQMVAGTYIIGSKGDKPDERVTNKNGEIMTMKEWLKSPSGSLFGSTWEDTLEDDWRKISANRNKLIPYLTKTAQDLITNAKHISKNDLRNIKLQKEIEFGNITGSGNMTKSETGYVKIGEGSKEGKTLILEYTENESEAIKLETLGDLLDLLYKYKKCKLMTPEVLNIKYANTIDLLPSKENLKEFKVGILKFNK